MCNLYQAVNESDLRPRADRAEVPVLRAAVCQAGSRCVCACARALGHGAWARGDAKTDTNTGTQNKRGKTATFSMRVPLCSVCVRARVPLQHG